MSSLRALTHRYAALTLVLVVLALAVKALVPAGYMISPAGERFLSVTICADASGTPKQMRIAIPDKNETSGDQSEAADKSQPCAFSGLGHAALGGADPVLLAAALAFILLCARGCLTAARIANSLTDPPEAGSMALRRITGARRRKLGYIMQINTMKRALLGATVLAATTGAFNAPLQAQGIGQRQEEIIVTASLQGTPTAPTPEAARKELERVPGATGLVEDEGFADIFAQSIGDVLELTPGVFADTSAQRESR
ncbi:MAG: hypothetical protein MUF47_12630, partial [Porphyrobacter sp.]|nr:hypothetical protein [Porphyrobacter sp.]